MEKIILIIMVIYNALANGWEISKVGVKGFALTKKKLDCSDSFPLIMNNLLKNISYKNQILTKNNFTCEI